MDGGCHSKPPLSSIAKRVRSAAICGKTSFSMDVGRSSILSSIFGLNMYMPVGMRVGTKTMNNESNL